MWAVSPEVVAAAEEAHCQASQRRVLWRRDAARRRVTDALGVVRASGEWLALPLVAPLALHRDPFLVSATLEVVEGLLSCVPVHRIPWLDRAFRARSPWHWPILARWEQLEVRDLDAVAQRAGGSVLLRLATFHACGYVREAALRHRQLDNAGEAIPQCLIRLNDWVPAVRVAAGEALRSRTRLSSAARLVAALPLIDAAARWGRMDGDAILQEIDALLCSGPGVRSLAAGLHDSNPRVRRSSYRRASVSPALMGSDLYAEALDDRDPFIRVWACRHLVSAPAANGFDQLAARLLADRFARVRATAFPVALDRGVTGDVARLLCDTHALVRALAQAQMLIEGRDVVAHYHAARLSPRARTCAVALVGLAETTAGAEPATFRPFLFDERPRVRRAALRALAVLRVPDLPELCVRALDDPHPGPARAARDLILAGRLRVDPAALKVAFERAASDQGRLVVLGAMAALDHWRQIGALLDAVAASGGVRTRLLCRVHRWIGRSGTRCFTRPTASDRRRALDALDRARLPPADHAAIVRALGDEDGLR